MKAYSIIVFIIFISCKSQKTPKPSKMRTFNIEKFNASIKQRADQNPAFKNNSNRNNRYQYQEGNMIITLDQQDNGFYKEQRKIENNVREMVYVYYDDTNSLAYEGETFMGSNIGIHKRYSKDGTLIEEIDYDAKLKSFGFLTREEMKTIMKNSFGIDIEREDELLQISLKKKNGRDIWEIACQAHPEKQINYQYAYIFDAKTGEFIEKNKFFYGQ